MTPKSPLLNPPRFAQLLCVAGIASAVLFALIFSMTYLEWIPTAHSAERPLSRRFTVMLLLSTIIAGAWVLATPLVLYVRSGHRRTATVEPPRRVSSSIDPRVGIEFWWPSLQPLISVTERLGYLACLFTFLSLTLALTQLAHETLQWSLSTAFGGALILIIPLFLELRRKLHAWQLRYYTHHHYEIPLFSTRAAPQARAS